MKFMPRVTTFFKKIVRSENFIPLLIVFVFAILAGRTLIFEKGYFNMHDDLQMMRQLELEKCFNDGQIPCRWVPDMGYGYGFPLFNFYPPLPYLVGAVFRILQFSFVDTAKLVFALSFLLSGITMYFLSKEFFGKWGGVVSSIFYIWAPYHSVDVYVRGAMNEAWALIWFPLILWAAFRLIKEKKKVAKWVIALALSWVGLLLSHNLMAMIFFPVFAVWCFIFWVKGRDWKKFLQVASSGVIAFALAAFFSLPAILEQKYVHIDTLTQGYYEYIAHFATIGQLLFTRFWGYGASVWGPPDGMPFQVGHVHWILSLILLGIWVFSVFVKKKKALLKNYLFIIPLFILIGWFAAFMAHQNSTFIWQLVPTLSIVQFPWRFLTLVILAFSFVAGSIFILLPKKAAAISGTILIATLVILNWNYFLPVGGKMGPLTDQEKFSDAAWDLQRTAGIFDYLPATAMENPKDAPKGIGEIMDGEGVIGDFSQGTNWANFTIDLSTDATVRLNIFEFPNWKITIDGTNAESYVPTTERWGRMYVNIPKGSHTVSLKLENTPIRTIANIISLVSIVGLLTYLLIGNKVLQFKRG